MVSYIPFYIFGTVVVVGAFTYFIALYFFDRRYKRGIAAEHSRLANPILEGVSLPQLHDARWELVEEKDDRPAMLLGDFVAYESGAIYLGKNRLGYWPRYGSELFRAHGQDKQSRLQTQALKSIAGGDVDGLL